MMVPVRCFTCGKVVGQYWDAYQERLAHGEKAKDILDSLGVERYCCRRMLLTHVDLVNDLGPDG